MNPNQCVDTHRVSIEITGDAVTKQMIATKRIYRLAAASGASKLRIDFGVCVESPTLVNAISAKLSLLAPPDEIKIRELVRRRDLR